MGLPPIIIREATRIARLTTMSTRAQFTIDELRKQMDYNKNIRNMSVIAHVDHVSTPKRCDARGIHSMARCRKRRETNEGLVGW